MESNHQRLEKRTQAATIAFCRQYITPPSPACKGNGGPELSNPPPVRKSHQHLRPPLPFFGAI
jgi:hypothetical protein